MDSEACMFATSQKRGEKGRQIASSGQDNTDLLSDDCLLDSGQVLQWPKKEMSVRRTTEVVNES